MLLLNEEFSKLFRKPIKIGLSEKKARILNVLEQAKFATSSIEATNLLYTLGEKENKEDGCYDVYVNNKKKFLKHQKLNKYNGKTVEMYTSSTPREERPSFFPNEVAWFWTLFTNLNEKEAHWYADQVIKHKNLEIMMYILSQPLELYKVNSNEFSHEAKKIKRKLLKIK